MGLKQYTNDVRKAAIEGEARLVSSVLRSTSSRSETAPSLRTSESRPGTSPQPYGRTEQWLQEVRPGEEYMDGRSTSPTTLPTSRGQRPSSLRYLDPIDTSDSASVFSNDVLDHFSRLRIDQDREYSPLPSNSSHARTRSPTSLYSAFTPSAVWSMNTQVTSLPPPEDECEPESEEDLDALPDPIPDYHPKYPAQHLPRERRQPPAQKAPHIINNYFYASNVTNAGGHIRETTIQTSVSGAHRNRGHSWVPPSPGKFQL